MPKHLLTCTALAVLLMAAPAAAQAVFPQASGAWGQLPGTLNDTGSAAAHNTQGNIALRALRGKHAPIEGGSLTTAGAINYITTSISNQGDNNALEVLQAHNTQRADNSGVVRSNNNYVYKPDGVSLTNLTPGGK